MRRLLILLLTAIVSNGQILIGTLPTSLTKVPVPQPKDLGLYVRDQAALVTLGKALFWDMQAGSDGVTACATCHFHAGADHRLQNQLSPTFSGTQNIRPNKTATLGDFPFRKFADPANNQSAIQRDQRQVFGSSGVFQAKFLDAVFGVAQEDAAAKTATRFQIGGIQTRQVTSRNAPTVINAVFNTRNFWDGRARETFNGATPFGASDNVSALWIEVDEETLGKERIKLDKSSLASQAVGPPMNHVEMSYDGRNWQKLARKLLLLQPLGRQKVDPEDSVLGPLASEEKGLTTTYRQLLEAAFQPKYWQSEVTDDNGYGLMELNFSTFWGLAIQAYESTLVAGDSRYDRYLDGDTKALTEEEIRGLGVFRSNYCTTCHAGTELTSAAFTYTKLSSGFSQVQPSAWGFQRIGVSASGDDPGAGQTDPFGKPYLENVLLKDAEGAFKIPGLRNVELTGPYFHNGGQATLAQVVDFYRRAGDLPGATGPNVNQAALFPGLLTKAEDQSSLVVFLKSLTDDRVKFERAPFDHPSLCVPVGHEETEAGLVASPDGIGLTAVDKWALIPETGKKGNTVPLQTFEELLKGIGADGSRAHTLQQSCQP